MGKVIASCGHEIVNYPKDEVVVEYAEFVVDRSDMEHGGGEAIVCANMCKTCANQSWVKKAVKRAKKLKRQWEQRDE